MKKKDFEKAIDTCLSWIEEDAHSDPVCCNLTQYMADINNGCYSGYMDTPIRRKFEQLLHPLNSPTDNERGNRWLRNRGEDLEMTLSRRLTALLLFKEASIESGHPKLADKLYLEY